MDTKRREWHICRTKQMMAGQLQCLTTNDGHEKVWMVFTSDTKWWTRIYIYIYFFFFNRWCAEMLMVSTMFGRRPRVWTFCLCVTRDDDHQQSWRTMSVARIVCLVPAVCGDCLWAWWCSTMDGRRGHVWLMARSRRVLINDRRLGTIWR